MEIRDFDPKKGDFPQGDVCIFAIPESVKLSASATEIAPVNGRLIIQEGEATGHHHAITLPREMNFKPGGHAGMAAIDTNSPKLRKAFGGKKSTAPIAAEGTAKLYRDPAAIEELRRLGELTRVDLAVGILVVEGGPVVLTHEEHSGIRMPHAWLDDKGASRSGRYYVGRQIESAGAEERIVLD